MSSGELEGCSAAIDSVLHTGQESPFTPISLVMAIPTAKSLSPAELAKLEHAFATDPASESYKPLAEAYLAMGRFMEAMVVCKKGVKAHPNLADPRVLLARVYSDQGKDKKAIEELQGALQVAPQDKQVLRLLGALQLKNGENDAGKANLLKAYEAAPADEETRAVLAQFNIAVPAPVVAAPVVAAPVVAAPVVATAPQAPVLTPGSAPPPAVQTPMPAAVAAPAVFATPGASAQPLPAPAQVAAMSAEAPAPAPGSARSAPAPGVPAARPPPASRPAPQARPYVPPEEEEDVEDDDEEEEDSPRRSRAGKGRKSQSNLPLPAPALIFIALLLVFAVGLGSYSYLGNRRAQRNRDIKKHLAEASEQLKRDSYKSYQDACVAADKVLELDPESGSAHAYLAYAYAVRWGEHGGGDSARKLAEEHLDAAQKAGEVSSHLVAAQALMKTYSGKNADALKELDEKVKSFEVDGKQSSLLYLTLGLAQMNVGDLERSRENLEKAQALAPDDPRVYAALGNLYRRRGQDSVADKNYFSALRYDSGHPESLLGASLLLLEGDSPKFPAVAQMLKKLLDSNPPPSPRQLATAQLERSLLIARASLVMSGLEPDAQKKLGDETGVPVDRARAKAEVANAEETGFSLDRQNPELHLIKARRLQVEGNVEGAAAEVREAIKMDPSRALFHAELAKVLMLKPGGEKEAKEALVTAIGKMGESPKLLVLLGNAYRKMDKLDDAIEQYRRAVRDPKSKNPEARMYLGMALRDKGDFAGAKEALDKASVEYVGQSVKVAAVQTEMGRLYEAQNDKAKAEDAYTKALNADGEYAPAYYFYAKFLSGKDTGKARTTAQEYLKRDPKGEYAVEAQRMVQ